MSNLPNAPVPAYPEPVLVGDHLAMNLLNSIEVASKAETDCLRDGVGLVRWLEAAGAVTADNAATLYSFGPPALDQVARDAVELREWFRGLMDPVGGFKLTSSKHQLHPLNLILQEDDSYRQLTVSAGPVADCGHHAGLTVRRVNRWRNARQMLQPLAGAIADLFALEDLGLVRSCEGPTCSLVFIDRTKSHKRRWCSMAVCGNRSKAAAHRARASGRAG